MPENTARLSTALADRYKIESHLGEGGMANVYLAEDLKHHRKVAVKVLRPELAAVLGAERFVKEIETTANLQHPHILPLFDSGEADSFLYYVMPFIDGETLRDKLNRETQLGIDEAVNITTAIADALDYAHRNNVIHRDIKPENILLHDGRPMVADFGIALALSAAAGGRMTETGMSLGTPHYMSPEQATAEKELTNRSDIYSLGCVLYEMLTGEPPHMGNSAQQIIMKIVTDTPRPVTELRKSVPPHVAAATGKALEKLAADRFESAAKFAEALTNPAFALPTVAGTAALRATGNDWKQRFALPFAVVMTVLFVWAMLRTPPVVPQTVSRYSVALPKGEALFPFPDADLPRVTVSPDGARLVYVGVGEQNSQLWVRETDQLHATPLPGTDGAANPFFSRDGLRVGFWVDGVGWRVATLGGGPPTSLANIGTTRRGGSWGSDGDVYLDGTLPGSGLVRVADNGGAPETLTMMDTTLGEEAHLWPEALPSDLGVLFTVQRGGFVSLTQWDIAVADLTTGKHTALFPGVRAWYAASGHLLYVTADRTLMVVPFDEIALKVTGEPVVLQEDMRVGLAGGTDLAVSKTGRLFYTTGGGGAGGLAELVWVTQDGTAEEIDPSWTANFGSPRLSPDGKQLAVTIAENGEEQIWIKRLDPAGPPRRLTFGGSLNTVPAWTPDGQSVAFRSNRGNGFGIYAQRADGNGQAELLRDGVEPNGAVTYSPNGEWLVYGANARSDLHAMRIGVDSMIPLVATEFQQTAPAVSPNGRWLVYASNEQNPGSLFDLYASPIPNPDTLKWMVSMGGGIEPVWAHSGLELFYRDLTGLVAVEVLQGPSWETGEHRELFSFQGFRTDPLLWYYDVAPDGERFLMIRNLGADETTELIVVENFFEVLKAKVGN